MAYSALSRCPAEILKAIIEDVPNTDLPAVCLLNKKFSILAAPKLFSSIPLWIGLKSLGNLTNLASHTQLRVHVKEIVFSPVRIIEPKDAGVYFADVEEAWEYELDSASAVTLRLGELLASYHGYLAAQEYLAIGLSILHLISAHRVLHSRCSVLSVRRLTENF